MSSSVQMSFSLRVSSGVKTVHLLGSWDGYTGQLPLSKDKTSSKSGSWKGTFRFQNGTLEAGQRYWYYYIIDGYHASHNPSEDSTVAPTTGRALNILDVPKSKSSSSKSSSSSSKSSSRHSSSSSSSSKDKSSKRSSRSSDIPKGRPLSVSQIKAPKPVNPKATKNILEADYAYDNLAEHFADAIYDFQADSPVSSNGSDLSYRSDSSSPNSSLSGYSTPGSDCSSCTCERYGITREGERVRIDCRGVRCGYDDTNTTTTKKENNTHTNHRNGIVGRS